MKLRQKLAVVLASAMVVTAVPVVTMAASTSYVTKVVSAAKDSAFSTTLVVDVKDTTTTQAVQVIYLDITGGKFDSAKYTDTTKYAVQNDGETLAVTLAKTVKAGKINIPVYGKELTGDQVSIAIDGSQTGAIENATVVVANKSEKKATVTAKDAEVIDGTGTVANIIIEEPFANVIAGEKITLTLENSDYEFIAGGTATFERGLTAVGASVSGVVKTNDKQIITITVPAVPSGTDVTAPGRIVISGVKVDYTGKGAVATGDIDVTVSGDKIVEKTVTVAKVVEEGAKLTLVGEKPEEITAGQTEEVKVKLEEVVAGSFTKDKVVEVTLDNAYLAKLPTDFDYTMTKIHEDDDTTKGIIGFKFVVPASFAKQEFTLEVLTKLDAKGEVTLTASGQRAIGDDVSVVVANVTPSIEVKATPMNAKSGLKDQKGGEIVITETAKGNIEAGKKFQIELKDGMTFSDTAKFEVTEGDLIIEKIELDKTTKSILNVTVKRASRTASTLKITDFAINSDRTIADGSYAVEIKGAALGSGKIKVADFVKVGDKTSAVSAFTIGESYYLVDGVKHEMTAAPYIENGRTMVPIKYVAFALGLQEKDIMWDQTNKLVTIFGNRTIQLKVDSNVAIVNGASVTIDGKVVVKDGRTFVPVSQVGNLLGVTAKWDADTKTATFQN